ncbi:MAG: hypothetical protein Altm1KO_40120 [Alteromonas macleodii]
MSVEANQIIIPMYIESAQLYLQLSIAAIGLSVAFKEKILGQTQKKSVSLLLASSWLFFLITIALSAFYQYIAVKFLDKELDPTVVVKYFVSFVNEPGHVYGAMLITFFLGSILLVLSSASELWAQQNG